MKTAEDSVSLGFGQYKIQAKGWAASLAVFLGLALGIAGYVGVNAFAALRQDTSKILDELNVLTYILSLPEEQRPALAVPPALRDRLISHRPHS